MEIVGSVPAIGLIDIRIDLLGTRVFSQMNGLHIIVIRGGDIGFCSCFYVMNSRYHSEALTGITVSLSR